ncbi:MAG: UTP--glucose-1-phosphate uridylyltransferase [Chloroflexi bacterium]|nr:UTP--glucose-1-phosphate uridylyltransferase [Chloroflexota bacterium]
MEVRKAVIPAAGYGTRLLPASKSIPKELLPVVDRPAIQYVVEEAVAAGVQQVIIVTSQGKEALADYFDRAPGLEAVLAQRGAADLLASVQRLYQLAEFVYIRQHEQLGLGHAVLAARHAVGREPFAVLLPDELAISQPPAVGVAMEVARQRGGSAVVVAEVPEAQVSAYGIIAPEALEEGIWRVRGVIEKPRPEQAPSRLSLTGRYVFAPEVFDALDEVPPGPKGEIQLSDAIDLLCRKQPVYAVSFVGKRYDVGTPLGLLRAGVELALCRPDTAPAVRAWLRKLVQELADVTP